MIKIAINELKPVLAGLSKVVTNKSTLECLRCVRVDATPDHVTLTGTDLDLHATVRLSGATAEEPASFLVPLEHLLSLSRRLPPRSVLSLEEGQISCDLGTGRVSEKMEAPKVEEFPPTPEVGADPVPMPESFARRFLEALRCSSTDATRYILNGVQWDVSDRACHTLVGTDGKHLFSANSFDLPIEESLTVPSHKLLTWTGLAKLPWAIAARKTKDNTCVRIAAGDWTLTMRSIDATYPNWRQVIPSKEDQLTSVSLPEDHEFGKIVSGLPGGDLPDKPLDLLIEGGRVSLRDTVGGSSILLEGAKADGPDLTIRVNRDYLAKALDYGLNHIGLIDAMSPLHFTHEGRQLVVMPLRVADGPAHPVTNNPAPSEPQPERKPMTETNGRHTNGASTPPTHGDRRTSLPNPPTPEKPSIEAAIDKLDAFKTTLREALAGTSEVTALLRQAIRDQKAGEKEIHQVRQTLRSLQSVKL